MDTNIKKEAASFEQLKRELEKTQSLLNIFERIKTADVNAFSKDQFGYICDIIQNRLGKEFDETRNFIRFLEWMQSIVSKKGFGIRLIILMLTLKSSHHFLSCSQDSKNSSSQQSDIKAMIVLALRNMDDFQISSIETIQFEERELLQKVLEIIFKIIVLKPTFVEIKLILDLWKSYSNIFMAYIKQMRLLSGANIDDIKQILCEPIKYLLQEVGRSIDLIYRVQTLTQPIEQVEKFLRIVNFYIKILRILMAAVKQKDFVAPCEFFETHKKSKLLPKALLGTEIANLIEKNVQKDFDVLSKYVFQHPKVLKLLIGYMNDTSFDETFYMVETYLSTIMLNEDSSFIASKTEEFIKVFELCFNEPKSLEKSNSYDVMVSHFSALAMLDESPNLLTYFRETVLEDNFWLAAASSDILSLIQRYQHKHLTQYSDGLINEFHFWRECYSKFSLFSNDVKQMHILKLLNNCFDLCGSKILPNIFSEDVRFLLVNNLSNLEAESKNYNELYRLLSELAIGNGTIESYYKTIVYMKLLYNSIKMDDKTMKILAETTERILNLGTEQSKVFSLFLNASLKLISKYAEQMGSYDDGKFLAHMQTLKQVATYPGALKLLHFFTKSDSQQQIQRGNEALEKIFIDTSIDVNFESITEIIDFITAGKYMHSCLSYDNYREEPQSKRKCFEYTD